MLLIKAGANVNAESKVRLSEENDIHDLIISYFSSFKWSVCNGYKHERLGCNLFNSYASLFDGYVSSHKWPDVKWYYIMMYHTNIYHPFNLPHPP